MLGRLLSHQHGVLNRLARVLAADYSMVVEPDHPVLLELDLADFVFALQARAFRIQHPQLNCPAVLAPHVEVLHRPHFLHENRPPRRPNALLLPLSAALALHAALALSAALALHAAQLYGLSMCYAEQVDSLRGEMVVPNCGDVELVAL